MTERSAPPLEIVSRDQGAWLVRRGPRRFLVPPALGRTLEEGARPAWLADLPETAPEGAGRPIWGRVTLLSEKLTIRLSNWLAPGARGAVLVLMAGTGLGALSSGGTPAGLPVDLVQWLGALFLVFASAVWHELGHAAALGREGFAPGSIGAGVLFVIPVLWTDVTAVGALPRAGRLRVDLAGVCFQLLAAGIYATAAGFAGPAAPALHLAAWGAAAACAWSLFPFLRTDGYWVLCDLCGLVTLDRPPPAGSSRFLAWFVALYRVANALFLVAVVATLPWRAYGLAFGLAYRAGLDPAGPWPRAAALAVTALLFAGLGVSAWKRLRRLAGRNNRV